MNGPHPTGYLCRIAAAGALVAATLAITGAPGAQAGAFEERPTRIETLPEIHDLPVDPVYDIRHRDQDARNAPDAAATSVDPDAPITARHGHWEARKGRGLREILEIWAEASGWTVAWESDHAYRLQASARFDGSFVEAAEDILVSYERATPPLFGTFYTGNKVLVVQSQASTITR